MLDFSAQLLIREEALKDLQAKIILASGEKDLKFQFELVENVGHEVLITAQVKMVNKLIFDAI